MAARISRRRFLGLLSLGALGAACRALPTGGAGSVSGASGDSDRSQSRKDASTSATLVRDGKPYFILGAAGAEFFEELAAAGANSVRTWGAENDPGIYDRAHAAGLSVCAGLWLAHVKDTPTGPTVFDYSDRRQVRRQFLKFPPYVRRYKDHPAILMWGVGNEVEPLAGRGNVDMWRAIEEIAAMIKAEDPAHPVITVVAGVHRTTIESIQRHVPSIDALGINGYAALPGAPGRLRELGWDKPFVVTEFGPPGPWGEVPSTAWGAPIEPTSSEKASIYRSHYEAAITSHRDRCWGSYVYYWGTEPGGGSTTHTWYSMFLGQERLGAVDAMQEAWTGKSPTERVPQILKWEADLAQSRVDPGSRHEARLVLHDPDGDPLLVRCEVRSESASGAPGRIISACLGEGQHGRGSSQVPVRMIFNAPEQTGDYRLFIYLTDGKGGAATMNTPFQVRRG